MNYENVNRLTKSILTHLDKEHLHAGYNYSPDELTAALDWVCRAARAWEPGEPLADIINRTRPTLYPISVLHEAINEVEKRDTELWAERLLMRAINRAVGNPIDPTRPGYEYPEGNGEPNQFNQQGQ